MRYDILNGEKPPLPSGEFEMLAKLGEGNYGAVYKVSFTLLEKQ